MNLVDTIVHASILLLLDFSTCNGQVNGLGRSAFSGIATGSATGTGRNFNTLGHISTTAGRGHASTSGTAVGGSQARLHQFARGFDQGIAGGGVAGGGAFGLTGTDLAGGVSLSGHFDVPGKTISFTDNQAFGGGRRRRSTEDVEGDEQSVLGRFQGNLKLAGNVLSQVPQFADGLVSGVQNLDEGIHQAFVPLAGDVQFGFIQRERKPADSSEPNDEIHLTVEPQDDVQPTRTEPIEPSDDVQSFNRDL